MARNKNINNTLCNLADIFLYPLLFFVSTSFFIRHLGQSQFGIWMLINTIVVSLQLFNFGIGSTVLKNIALYAAQKKHREQIRVVNNALSMTILLFTFCCVIGFTGFCFVAYRNLFHITTNLRLLCAKCFILAGFIVGIKFFEQIFTNYFKALEKYNIAAMLGSGNRLCTLTLNLFLLYFLSINIIWILVIMIIVNIIFAILGFVLMYRNLRGYQFSFNLKIPKHEASFALITWLQSLAIIITFQSDRYLIVSYFGLIALSYYALIATMFNHLHMCFNAIMPWLSPKFTKLYAQRKNSNELYLAARNVVTGISVLLLIILYLVYPYIFKIILGAKTAHEVKNYTKYFIVFELFFVLNIVPTYYFNAVGHERIYLYYTIFFSALTLCCMFISIHVFHSTISVLYGLIAACAISMYVLRMILSKILSGSYDPISCVVQIFPSILIGTFIVCENGLVKGFCIILAIATLYFTNVHGHKEKFIMLVNS